MKLQHLKLYIAFKPENKLVKVLEIIEVANNQCFFYKEDYYALVHLETGRQLLPSFARSFKQAKIEIIARLNNNLESIEEAFKNLAGYYEIINNRIIEK